jgi:glycosyl-4,4'-diaponeurosporenoate acyltransferase
MLSAEFSTIELFFIDLIYWLFVQGLVGFISAHLPPRLIDPRRRIYQTRRWEKDGSIYQRWFRIKNWKPIVWDAGRVFQKDFRKDHVDAADPQHLDRWIVETCRAEWCHRVTFVFILPLFSFNPPGMMYFWVLYDSLLNLVPIVVQRYNRPRLVRLMRRLTRLPAAQENATAGGHAAVLP